MSNYTTTIKELCENQFNFNLDNYPIFDETYRNTLNLKILNHFYFDEIAYETPQIFNFFLGVKMNEIMPYYNELYKMQKQILNDNNLFINYVMNEENTLKNIANTHLSSNSINNSLTQSNGTHSEQNTDNTTKKDVYQDTPNGPVNNTSFENFNYASNLDLAKQENQHHINVNATDETTNTNEQNTTGTQDSTNNSLGNKSLTGLTGLTKIDVLNKFNTSIKNIDMEIINRLSPLFFGLY